MHSTQQLSQIFHILIFHFSRWLQHCSYQQMKPGSKNEKLYLYYAVEMWLKMTSWLLMMDRIKFWHHKLNKECILKKKRNVWSSWQEDHSAALMHSSPVNWVCFLECGWRQRQPRQPLKMGTALPSMQINSSQQAVNGTGRHLSTECVSVCFTVIPREVCILI